MANEYLTEEELSAVNELIEKLPPEDLKKAVGGLTTVQKKKLVAVGILTISVFAGIKSFFDGSESGSQSDNMILNPVYKKSTYYDSNGDLNNKYVIKKVNDKECIFNKTDLEPRGIVMRFLTGETHTPKAGSIGIPIELLHEDQ